MQFEEIEGRAEMKVLIVSFDARREISAGGTLYQGDAGLETSPGTGKDMQRKTMHRL